MTIPDCCRAPRKLSCSLIQGSELTNVREAEDRLPVSDTDEAQETLLLSL